MENKAVILRQLTGVEKIRQEAYYREKRLHDEASAIPASTQVMFKAGTALKEKVNTKPAKNSKKK